MIQMCDILGYILAITTGVAFLVMIYSLMKVAGESDEAMEKEYRIAMQNHKKK